MKPLTLRMRDAAGQATIDASGLTPCQLATLSSAQVSRVRVRVGTSTLAVGDLFDVSGQPGQSLRIQCGDEGRLLNDVGAGQSGGRLIVDGQVGVRAGHDMTGGQLRIDGDAGDYLGTGLLGGVIDVGGNVGDFASAALPGYRYGQSGGRISIAGNAGHRLADRMRRGVVSVSGNTGDWPAARLIAGTVVIQGDCGKGVASGMRRGTILLSQEPSFDDTTQFVDGGPVSPVFAALLLRTLRMLNQDVSESNESAHANTGRPQSKSAFPLPKIRLYGDLLVAGQGEVFLA